jgi:hypothetical protein
MSKKRRFLIVIGTTGVAAIAGLCVCATILARQIEPYIRDQAMDFLRAGFDSEVELASLSIRMPSFSSLRLLLTGGGGARAKVTGE